MALFQTSRKMLAPMARSVSRFSTAAAQKQQNMFSQDFGVAPSQSGKTFDLPPQNSIKDVPQQGWQLNTLVRTSSQPEAGNGRYAIEPVRAGSAVVQKLLVPMSKIESLGSLSNDVTITFSTVEELEKYIDMSFSEGGHSREDVLQVFEHFIYGFDGKRACLNVSTWTVNHADSKKEGLNVDVFESELPGGSTALVGEAMVDIQVNDELYMDYRKFKLPEFYLDYAKEHGFKDVRTVTMEAVYGGNFIAADKRPALGRSVYNAKAFNIANTTPSGSESLPFRGSLWRGL